MLVICVQSVYKINQTEKLKPCQKHINQKREREPRRTVFWCGVGQKQEEIPCLDEGERVAKPCLQLASNQN